MLRVNRKYLIGRFVFFLIRRNLHIHMVDYLDILFG